MLIDEMVWVNQRQIYSQFFSRTTYCTGLYPTRDLAVLETTEEAPPFEKFLGIPPM